MELWNDGFEENGIQIAYFCIDFLVLMQFQMWQKQKIAACGASLEKYGLNFFYRKCYFPLSLPSIPIFHHSMWLTEVNDHTPAIQRHW